MMTARNYAALINFTTPHNALIDTLTFIGVAADRAGTAAKPAWHQAQAHTANWGQFITGIPAKNLLTTAETKAEEWRAGERPTNVLLADTMRALADMIEYRRGDDPDRTRINVLKALVSLIALENNDD